MVIKATPAARQLWESINDKTAQDLLKDERFVLDQHRVYPFGIRIGGVGAIFGGESIGFVDAKRSDGLKWLKDEKYFVDRDVDKTFTFVKFKNPSY